MKKTYVALSIEIERFDCLDVLTASLDPYVNDFYTEDSLPWSEN